MRIDRSNATATNLAYDMAALDISGHVTTPTQPSEQDQEAVQAEGIPLNISGSDGEPSGYVMEDAFPTGTFVPHFPCFFEIKEPRNGTDELTLSLKGMQAEDKQRYHLHLCKLIETSPGGLVQFAEEIPDPSLKLERCKMEAYKQLAQSVQESLNQHSWKTNGSSDPEMYEKVNQYTERAKEINQQIQLKSEYCFSLLTTFYHKCLVIFKTDNETLASEISRDYDSLRKIDALSFRPFYPWLVLLINRLDEKSLRTLIKEAHQCDPYKTYALLVQFFLLKEFYRERYPFLVKEYQPMPILNVLKEFYPKDLFIPFKLAILEQPNSNHFLKLPQIANCLGEALGLLAMGNFSEAIKCINHNQPYLIGFSILHRYLALSWCLAGDFEKASQLVERSSYLLHFNDDDSYWQHEIVDMLKMGWGLTKTPQKLQLEDGPLEKFVKLAKNSSRGPLDLTLAQEFITVSVQKLSALENLPIVYFGVRWLASRLTCVDQRGNVDGYQALIKALHGLLSVLLTIYYQCEIVDAWISTNFEKIENEKGLRFNYTLKGIEFGLKEKERIPQFQFHEKLSITKDCMDSLVVCLLKKVFHVMMGLSFAPLISEYTSDHELPFPNDNPTIFMQILEQGLSSDTGKHGHKEARFKLAVGYLRGYLTFEPDKRPYPIDLKVLEWSKFCVFSLENPLLDGGALENEVYAQFYPKNFNRDSLNSSQTHFKEVLNFFTRLSNPYLQQLALRDAHLAVQGLIARSVTQTRQMPCDKDSLYAVFQFSQEYFGWRFGETFEAWGERLKQAEMSGPAAFEYNLINQTTTDVLTEEPEIIASFDSKKTRAILRWLLAFWKEFHQITTEKNAAIAVGESEETGESSSKTRDWSSGVETEVWKEMIKKNKPDKLPNFKKLSHLERLSLTDLIREKHSHEVEVEKLRKFKKPQGVKSNQIHLILSAALLTCCEYGREEASHSLFVESEAEALRLYQIFLEIAAERLIRKAIIQAGASLWNVPDIEQAKSVLEPALKQIIGAFHGPESHSTGKGPLQNHFNAGVVISSMAVVNTHIFY